MVLPAGGVLLKEEPPLAVMLPLGELLPKPKPAGSVRRLLGVPLAVMLPEAGEPLAVMLPLRGDCTPAGMVGSPSS